MPSKFARWIKHDPPAKKLKGVNPRYLQREQHPPQASFNPALRLVLPYDGVIMMNPSEEARIHAQMNRTEPAYDVVLTGHLEVEPPPDCPRFRCHAIRIRFEAHMEPDGPSAVVPDQMLFERELKIAENDEGGIVIDGLQRFEFSLIIPNTVPPRDWGEWGRILDELHAILEGVEADPRPAVSPLPSPSVSAPPPSPGFLSLGKKRAKSKEVVTTSRVPPYSPRTSTDIPWLEGNHSAILTIRLIYNPDPAGGVQSLSETSKGHAAGLGEFNLHLFSDVWTLASLLRTSIAIMDIPPTTTIFNAVVYLVQTAVITLPDTDGGGGSTREQKFTKKFLLMEKGQAVGRSHPHPEPTLPALWRGKGAGGWDDGELILEMHGRVVENDYIARPSTLPSIQSPVRTSHTIEVSVFFSVWGEDAYARPMHTPGPGGLRIMKISKSVMLPPCSILPELMRLPTYGDEEAEPTFATSHIYMICSCNLTMEDVQARMRAALAKEKEEEVQDAHWLRHMKDLEHRD